METAIPSSAGYVRDIAQETKTARRRGEVGGSNSKNASRKRARRKYIKAKGSCSGDIHHRDGNSQNNAISNLVCVPASRNRSFKRTKRAGKKNKRS